jgi:acyl carrier protein
MQVLNSVQAIFREIFDNPDLVILPATGPSDISDWDSVAQVKIVLGLEEAFGTQFTTSEVAEFHTVGDFVGALERRNA